MMRDKIIIMAILRLRSMMCLMILKLLIFSCLMTRLNSMTGILLAFLLIDHNFISISVCLYNLSYCNSYMQILTACKYHSLLLINLLLFLLQKCFIESINQVIDINNKRSTKDWNSKDKEDNLHI